MKPAAGRALQPLRERGASHRSTGVLAWLWAQPILREPGEREGLSLCMILLAYCAWSFCSQNFCLWHLHVPWALPCSLAHCHPGQSTVPSHLHLLGQFPPFPPQLIALPLPSSPKPWRQPSLPGSQCRPETSPVAAPPHPSSQHLPSWSKRQRWVGDAVRSGLLKGASVFSWSGNPACPSLKAFSPYHCY